MLRSLDALEKGFRQKAKQSKEECSDELEKIRQLIYVIAHIHRAFNEGYKLDTLAHSLAYICFLELFRISGHILFLSCNGLYRNAYDNIRYALESIVQALYIDLRHPNINIETKIEILREVENKREYHAVRLIDELEIDYKDELKTEYKKLSQIIHPSHKQVVATWQDITKDRGVPVTIDCKEILRIFDLMKKMYDIFFFLIITHFPETKETLRKNPDFIKDTKVNKLTLLSRTFKVRL